jgi:transposase-like protein
MEEETNTDYIAKENGEIEDHTFVCKNCGAEYLVKAEYTLRRIIFLEKEKERLHG